MLAVVVVAASGSRCTVHFVRSSLLQPISNNPIVKSEVNFFIDLNDFGCVL